MCIEKKIQVYKVIPEELKLAINNLDLSKIMSNKAIKLVCLLIQKGMQNNHDLSSYIPLPVSYLQKVFTPYYHTDFFNLLKSKNIIECNEKYKQGSKAFPGYSKAYRINPNLLNGEFVSTSYQDAKFKNEQDLYININRTYFYTNLNDSTKDNSSSSIMHIITKLFEKSLIFDDLSSLYFDSDKIWENTKAQISYISTKVFKIDAEVSQNYFEVINHITGSTYHTTKEKALRWSMENSYTLIQDGKYFYIDDLDRYVATKQRNMLLNYKWHIAKLDKKIFYADRNNTNNRLDHNLTCLNKGTMKIIKEDNGLVEIDMKNCQFAIHAYWMKQEDLCVQEDVRMYYDICSKGILYDELAKSLKTSREEAKQVMMELAFSSEKNYTPSRKLFKEHFPNVLAHIDGFKKEKKNSRLFSIELQELESEIFVDNLYPNMKELGLFCLTKHDSIIVKKADDEKAVELIRAYFNHLGLECVLDVGGTQVTISCDDKGSQNWNGGVSDTQIREETEMAIEHKPEAELTIEQNECETFVEPGNRPDWWQSLDYFKENYGEDGAKEMYEGQINFIVRF